MWEFLWCCHSIAHSFKTVPWLGSLQNTQLKYFAVILFYKNFKGLWRHFVCCKPAGVLQLFWKTWALSSRPEKIPLHSFFLVFLWHVIASSLLLLISLKKKGQENILELIENLLVRILLPQLPLVAVNEFSTSLCSLLICRYFWAFFNNSLAH